MDMFLYDKKTRALGECTSLPKHIGISIWENLDYYFLYPDGDPDDAKLNRILFGSRSIF